MVQSQVLNKILSTKDYSLIRMNNFDESYFSTYKNEFRFIKNHFEKYGVIPDKETFLNQFPDFDIFEVTDSDRYLIDELVCDRNVHIIANSYNDIRDNVNNGKSDKAVDIFKNTVDKLQKTKILEAVDIIHDTSRYSMYVDKMNNYNQHYIPTGYKELDNLLGGWDRNEDVATICARTGIGKTWFVLKSASTACEAGFKVGVYSGEMSENAVGYRTDTIMSHLSNFSMLHGDSSIEVEYKSFLNNLSADKDKHLYVLTPQKLGGFATVDDLEMFIDKYNLDILFIDQYSLMEDRRHAKQTNEQIADISKDVKNLQVAKRIPIITVAQQNRSESTDAHNTTQIGLSDRIGQDSSIVIFLDYKSGISTIELNKARNCETGKKLNYITDINHGVWEYAPVEADALAGVQCEALRNEFEEDNGSDEF